MVNRHGSLHRWLVATWVALCQLGALTGLLLLLNATRAVNGSEPFVLTNGAAWLVLAEAALWLWPFFLGAVAAGLVRRPDTAAACLGLTGAIGTLHGFSAMIAIDLVIHGAGWTAPGETSASDVGLLILLLWVAMTLGVVAQFAISGVPVLVLRWLRSSRTAASSLAIAWSGVVTVLVWLAVRHWPGYPFP